MPSVTDADGTAVLELHRAADRARQRIVHRRLLRAALDVVYRAPVCNAKLFLAVPAIQKRVKLVVTGSVVSSLVAGAVMLRISLLTLACLSFFLGSAVDSGQGKRSVADLIADLKKPEAERLKAIQELEALGEKAAEAAPALVDLLSLKDEDTRLQTAIALGKIGPAAVAPLTKALEARDEETRFYAAWGLAFVGPPAKGATSAVAKALSDKSAQVRRKAAYALGRIDPDRAVAVGALVTALHDKDEDVRQAAAETLPKMGDLAVPALIKELQNDKPNQAAVAVRILGELGGAAAAAVPELKTLLHAPSKGLADPAATALSKIGAPALPVLSAAAIDDDAT